MKKYLLLVILVWNISVIGFSQNQRIDFSWLEGEWEKKNEKADKTTIEVWKWDSNVWLGLGVTIQDNDTIFSEKLSVRKVRGNYNYIAEVEHNPNPVNFVIKDLSVNKFIAVNPQHDFPKKIIYKREGDELKVTISGDGKSIDFEFIRID